jgi:hypothetical protein
VANYGIDAEIIYDNDGPLGQYGPFNAERNVVLGVVSWGWTDSTSPAAPQLDFASMFATNREFPASTYGVRGPGNIGALMYDGEWRGGLAPKRKVPVFAPYHIQLVLLVVTAPFLAQDALTLYHHIQPSAGNTKQSPRTHL